MNENKTNKILSLKQASPLIHEQSAKQTIVFTNGCFDLLHVGHIRSLQNAKSHGDVLIVGLNTDASVRRLKGSNRPIMSERERSEVLAALECVDYVILFDDDNAINIIKTLVPHVYVKAGYTRDKLPEAAILETLGTEVVLLDLIAMPISTTSIIERIRASS